MLRVAWVFMLTPTFLPLLAHLVCVSARDRATGVSDKHLSSIRAFTFSFPLQSVFFGIANSA